MGKVEDTIRETEESFITSFELIVSSKLAISGAESLVVGVSGGADSVALLLALHKAGVKIHVLHCNFGLRGWESDRDTKFVRDLCKRLDVPIRVCYVDTAKYMEANKVSAEVACRDLRYAQFRKLKKQINADRIAVAHNREDQAETLMLNLLRGCGVAGLRAMVPDTGEIIRPLLNISRETIVNYLRIKGELYVTDSTNLKSEYNRNFLRNKVFPLLRRRWTNASESMCKTARIMAQEEKVLNWTRNLFIPNPEVLEFKSIDQAPDSQWLIDRFARPLGASESQCQEMLRAYLDPEYTSGKAWYVANGCIAGERDRFEFIFINKEDQLPAGKKISFKITVTKYEVTPEVIDRACNASLDTFWTPLRESEIDFMIPPTDDRIEPLGMAGSMKVSKVYKDAKLTRAQKERVLGAYVRGTDTLLWLEGLKRSRHKLVTDKCKFVYEYKLSH